MRPERSNLVYRVRLTGEGVDVTALWPLLTADEQRRADRFLATEPRQQFVACRAALRLILAQLLGVAAGDIRLAQDRWGKPCLGSVRSDRLAVRPSDQATQFNISHSHGLGLIAISPSAVGVDLERRRRLETSSLSRLLLSHLEAADWRRLPSPSSRSNCCDCGSARKRCSRLWDWASRIACGKSTCQCPLPMPGRLLPVQSILRFSCIWTSRRTASATGGPWPSTGPYSRCRWTIITLLPLLPPRRRPRSNCAISTGLPCRSSRMMSVPAALVGPAGGLWELSQP